jgi:aryl-alcohol dehydrogenase
MKITAAITREAHQRFCIEEVDLLGPKDDEILVRIEAVGLCHSDILVVEQVLPVQLPAVLGHEGAGVVEAVGAKVTKVRPGDKVVMTFNSCGTCTSCRKGEPAYCLNWAPLNYGGARADGSPTLCSCGNPLSGNFFGQSSFASYALGNERNVVKVADDAALALLGPLGCGIQTGAGAVMRALAAQAGSSIIVFGGGSVGLAAVMGAKVRGCKEIILVEPMPERRALGLELGATHTIDPREGNISARIGEILPAGADYAVDTSGAVPAMQAAADALGMRGKLGLVGVPSKADAAINFNVLSFLSRGLRVQAIIEGDSIPDEFIPELVALHAAGKFPLEKLVKTYPFAEINRAVEEQKQGVCVKAVLVF